MNQSEPAPVPILVVDDEELIVAALGQILRQAKYEVIALSQPLLALDELKRREFSVIISDQRMPGLSGLELLAEARRLQPNATRILTTGVLDLETVIEAINQGEIFRFIVKPWLREEFLVTVTNAVQRYELLCQHARLQASAKSTHEELQKTNALLEKRTTQLSLQDRQLADQNRAMEEIRGRSVDVCVSILESFYPSLGAQARCVARVCHALADSLALSASDRSALGVAALLHDLGLVSCPRQLIRRWQENPEDLEPGEAELIRRHPVLSQELAPSGPAPEQVGQIIRAHHEQFDGRGYPDGLQRENIPWLARLLSVAVAYASSNLAPTETLERIKHQAGTLFDPEAVRALSRALQLHDLPGRERVIALKDLAPGMVISRGIYSHNGLLLIPEGQRLDEIWIKKLASHHRVNPITQSLAVYC